MAGAHSATLVRRRLGESLRCYAERIVSSVHNRSSDVFDVAARDYADPSSLDLREKQLIAATAYLLRQPH